MSVSTRTDLDAAYKQGWDDATERCAQRHIDRIADVLDAIHRHADDVEQLRHHILAALGHGGAA